jgi:hypothetical protein
VVGLAACLCQGRPTSCTAHPGPQRTANTTSSTGGLPSKPATCQVIGAAPPGQTQQPTDVWHSCVLQRHGTACPLPYGHPRTYQLCISRHVAPVNLAAHHLPCIGPNATWATRPPLTAASGLVPGAGGMQERSHIVLQDSQVLKGCTCPPFDTSCADRLVKARMQCQQGYDSWFPFFPSRNRS